MATTYFFKKGDRVRLHDRAENLYKEFFKKDRVYTVGENEYGTLCVFVNDKDGPYGTPSNRNFELYNPIVIGGE